MRSVGGSCACLLAGLLVGLVPHEGLAQMAMHHGGETENQVAPEDLPVPRPMKGIGNAHVPITASAEAQRWFDQGLNLLNDFWEYEAARAFQQGVRVDPACAMCYWGLFKAQVFYHSTSPGYAPASLARAMALIDRVSERERLYLQATSAPFPQQADIWRELVRKYPDDLQARVFLAALVPDGPSALQDVIRDDPRNSAAHHMYVHALEASDHPERALASADVLARLAPASGHMVHMPGHIYFRTGNYARAERAFRASMRVDETYMRDQGVSPDDDWNYVHNLMYAVANFLEEGKFTAATALSAKLGYARGQFDSTLYIYSTRDSMSRLNLALPVALRTADWAQVAALAGTAVVDPAHPNLAFLRRCLVDVATGMGAVARGDLVSAERASSAVVAALRPAAAGAAVPAPAAGTNPDGTNTTAAQPPQKRRMSDALLPPILTTLSIMSLELRGSLAAARHQTAEAVGLFEQAQREETALGYREPPIYIRPVAEAEGAAFLESGEWARAKDAYQRALVARPRSGFALYGIAVSLERSGDPGARGAYKAFLDAWKDADRSIPSVVDAKARAKSSARASAQGRVEDPALAVRDQLAQSASLAARWLDSPDPRFRAWGAFLVLRDSERALLPRLVALIRDHRVATGPVTASERDEHHAMLAVLDAFIQLNGYPDIAPEIAARLYPEFPTQALILLSRRGAARPRGADRLLLDIVRAERTATGAWLTAANVLTANGVTGVAAAIVGGTTIDVRVRVVDDGSAPAPSTGRGGSCPFGAAGPSVPGWPDVGNYYLTAHLHPSGLSGTSIGPVSRGVDPTFSMRVVSGPDPVVPHADFVCDDMMTWYLPEGRDRIAERLLASLAREAPDAPSLRLHVTRTIVWRDNDQYVRAFADRVREERATLGAVLDKLVAAGAMTSTERQTAAPVMAVTIVDARTSRGVDLPQTAGFGPGVTVAPVRRP